jgi:hypothetical protein
VLISRNKVCSINLQHAIALTCLEEILMIEYHTLMLHANLLGISDGRTPIAPPFTVDMISPKFPITNLPAFGKCIASAQAVLESCIRIPPAEIPSIPGIMFPRVVHALLILIVAASAILGSAHGESNLQSTLRAKDVSDLAISEYIDRIVDMFRKSPGPVRGRATKAVTILTLLKIWYAKNILHDTEDSSGSQPLASATHQGRATTNAPGTEPGILMDMENFPTPNNTQSTNFFLGSLSNDFPAPNLLNIDAMLESGQPLPLREEQYAFFESLVEGPGGPPWTLFDDAMDVFDWM